jgi:hypothetical protein
MLNAAKEADIDLRPQLATSELRSMRGAQNVTFTDISILFYRDAMMSR